MLVRTARVNRHLKLRFVCVCVWLFQHTGNKAAYKPILMSILVDLTAGNIEIEAM